MADEMIQNVVFFIIIVWLLKQFIVYEVKKFFKFISVSKIYHT